MKLRDLNCFRYVIVTLGLLSLTHVATADEWIVSADGNGHFSDIQSAVDIANDGDQITVFPGVYVGSGDYVVDISGKTLFIVSTDGPSSTRIDGQNQRGGIRWQGDGNGNGVILGFWFNNCSSSEHGGGLLLENTSPEVEYCEFINGQAKFGGGADLFQSASVFRHCQFHSNDASDKGGALYANASDYTLENCLFQSNSSSARGGAIRNWESNGEVMECMFQWNDGGSRGGAIHSQSNSAGNYTACQFISNTCTSLGGAVVDNTNSNSVYWGCYFQGNTSTGAGGGQGRGGAAYADNSSVTFHDCTFESNAASSVGGAIYNWSCAGTCFAGTIRNNTASSGGAIYTSQSSYTQQLADISICSNSMPQIHGNWSSSGIGGVCIADDCDDLDSDTDSDGDGLPDVCDPCPTWPYECSDDGQTITVYPGQDIQSAIDAIVSGGTVVLSGSNGGGWEASGLSFGGKDLHLKGEVSGSGGLLTRINGGFQGTTILSLNSGETSASIIETIEFVEGSSTTNAGALLIEGSSPQIIGCHFSICSASSWGGAVYVKSATSSPTFTSCVFNDNTAAYGGGCYLREGSHATFTDCLFDHNHAVGRGGALRAYDGATLELVTCQFEYNTCDSSGGAMHLENAEVNASGCEFIGNTAPYSAGVGMTSSDGAFVDSLFLNNSATEIGGGLYVYQSEPAVTDCEFRGNYASLGGAIRSAEVTAGPNIRGTTFCGNYVDQISGPWQSVVAVRSNTGSDNCFSESCDDSDKDGIVDGCDPDPAGNGIAGPLDDGSWVLWNNAYLGQGEGASVSTPCAIDGDLAAINCVGRGVCVYRRNPNTQEWQFDAWLDGNGIVESDIMSFFGQSIDISGNYLAVGAPRRDAYGSGNRCGSVYLYVTTGDGAWQLESEFKQDDIDGYEYGQKVAFGDNYLFASAPGSTVHWNSFGEQGNGLEGELSVGGTSNYGGSLAAGGNHVIVGDVPHNGQGFGNTAYIYRVENGAVYQEAALQGDDYTNRAGFARAVSIDHSGVCAISTSGLKAVFVFRRGESATWELDGQFDYGSVPASPLGGNLDLTHHDVVIRGNDLLVAGGEGGGLIRHYVFSSGGQEWHESSQITTQIPTGLTIDLDQDTLISTDQFGSYSGGTTSMIGGGVGVISTRSNGQWPISPPHPMPMMTTDIGLPLVTNDGWISAAFDSGDVATTIAGGYEWAFVASSEWGPTQASWDAIRIYRRESAGWVFKQLFRVAGTFGQFSPSLAADGDHLLAGYILPGSAGFVDCYSLQSNGTWQWTDHLTGEALKNDGWINAGSIGVSVDIHADVVAIGASCYSWATPCLGGETGSIVAARIDVNGDIQPVASQPNPESDVSGLDFFGWASAVRENADGSATLAVGNVDLDSVYIYQLNQSDVLAHVDTLAAPNISGVNDFGREVEIAGDHLAVGCSMSGAGTHGAVMYELSETGMASPAGELQAQGLGNVYSQYHLRNRIALTEDGTVALGIPMLSHVESQSGGCVLFNCITWPDTNEKEWLDGVLCTAMPGQLESNYVGLGGMRLGLGVAFIGDQVIAGGTPTSDPIALAFDIDPSRVYWTDYQWSSSVPGLNWISMWSDWPDATDTGVFNQWPDAEIDVMWFNDVIHDMEVSLCKVNIDPEGTFDGGARSLSGDLTISGPVDMGVGAVAIHKPAVFTVGGSTVIGQSDLSGRLELRGGATLQTSQLTIEPNSAMVIDLYTSNSVTVNDPPIIAGTLRVSLGAIDPGSLEEGDSFTVIQSAAAPLTGEGKFDLIVLPGLPEGLAFQTEYVEGLRGGWVVNVNVVSLAGLLNFGSPANLPVTGQPTAVEVVDLTGDGAEEICVTFAGSPGQLMIFENDGAGGVAQQIVLPTGDMPIDVTSGDFDGDLRMDLAVANNLSLDVTLYYNDDDDPSNGMVTVVLNVAGPPTCLAGINANYDAPDDLVVGLADTDGDGNGFWAIYTGTLGVRGAGPGGGMTGGGGLTTGGEPVFGDPSDDEDQKTIIFFGGTSTGRADVGKNNSVPGLQGLSLSIDHYDAGADPQGLTHADLNGDGHDDIILSSGLNGSMAVLLADPTMPSTFLPALQIPIGDSPTRVTAVDFDQDGNMDLAVIVDSDGDSRVRVLQNDGNMAFTTIDTAEDEGVVLLDSGDISGNGVSELVTIGDGSALRGMGDPILSLRPLNSSTTCAGDADATGFVNIEDLLVVLSEYGSCPAGCAADFDDDGDVDVDDMLVVIGNWGPCPRQ